MSRKPKLLQTEEEILSVAKKETGSTLALIMTARKGPKHQIHRHRSILAMTTLRQSSTVGRVN